MTDEKKTRTIKTLDQKIADAEAAVAAAEQKVADLKATKSLNETFNDVGVDARISYEYGRGDSRGIELGKVLAVLDDEGSKKLIVLPDGKTTTVTIRPSQIREVL